MTFNTKSIRMSKLRMRILVRTCEHHTSNHNLRTPAQPTTTLSSTAESIADSIAEQYSAAMDNAIDDAARMETQRNEAREQAAALLQANQELERRITALALRLRTRIALIATLGRHEIQDDTIGPVALLGMDWQAPHDVEVTEEVIQALLAMPV